MVFCRCVHPLAPVQTPAAHGGNGVTAALTARPRVAGQRDPARRPTPDGLPETWAVPRGWGRTFDRLGGRKNLRDGCAITVPAESRRVFSSRERTLLGLIYDKLYRPIPDLTIG